MGLLAAYLCSSVGGVVAVQKTSVRWTPSSAAYGATAAERTAPPMRLTEGGEACADRPRGGSPAALCTGNRHRKNDMSTAAVCRHLLAFFLYLGRLISMARKYLIRNDIR